MNTPFDYAAWICENRKFRKNQQLELWAPEVGASAGVSSHLRTKQPTSGTRLHRFRGVKIRVCANVLPDSGSTLGVVQNEKKVPGVRFLAISSTTCLVSDVFEGEIFRKLHWERISGCPFRRLTRFFWENEIWIFKKFPTDAGPTLGIV